MVAPAPTLIKFETSPNLQQKPLSSLVRKSALAIFLIANLVVSASALPSLGDGADISLAAERRLGDRIAREIYRDPDFLDDPVIADHVQRVWQPLLAAARTRGDLGNEMAERYAWDILLGRDRTVNAFALPGGYFGLHLGLLAVVGSDDELASVLGHELSHVTQRHISRLMARQGQIAPWTIGAMILGALAASKSADAANALIVGGQAVSAQSQLNFSRDMEREADRLGFGVMTQAGFDGRGFVGMFDKLQQASRLNDNGAYPYLRSHPLTTERIADMQSRQLLDAQASPKAPSLSHALVAARARVLANPGPDALLAMVRDADSPDTQAAPPARQAGLFYAAALAGSRLRDARAARSAVERLTALVRSDPAAQQLTTWLAVELSLAADDVTTAARLLEGGATFGPTLGPAAWTEPRRPHLMLEAQVALLTGTGLGRLTERLQTWLAAHPRDAQAWQRLASAYALQGQPLRGLRAEAEAQVARLDPAGALDRLQAAQDLLRQAGGVRGSADHVEASIIDTRRRQLESMLREQALER
ncbi:MAG: M48 family metalloprotease [Betaproteobacteria bacterium]